VTGRLRDLEVRPGAPLRDEELPSVCVIIPTLDGLRMLEDCLPQLLGSRYPAEKLRVVVIDNGSRDGTAQALRSRWPAVHVLSNPRNLGFTLPCNQGADAAGSAEVLVFLNNDIQVEANWLRELVGPIARGECQSTGAKMLYHDGSGAEFDGGGSNFQGFAFGRDGALGAEQQADFPRKCLFACGGAAAFQADVFREVGGFDPEYFAYYEDLDLGWRLWLMGHEVHFVPTAVCHHLVSNTSRTFPPEQIRLLQVRNALCTCFKNYDQGNFDRILPALLALAMRRMWVMARIGDDRSFRIESADGRPPGFAQRLLTLSKGGLRVPRIAAADFLGINDVLGNWKHWTERRQAVQAARRRSDAEIFRLFVKPLTCVEGEQGYMELQGELLSHFGIDELFGDGRDSI
jgi:GT2 family glycosyltransferase